MNLSENLGIFTHGDVYRFISEHSSDHYVHAIPCHTSPSMHFNIMNEAVNESLRK